MYIFELDTVFFTYHLALNLLAELVLFCDARVYADHLDSTNYRCFKTAVISIQFAMGLTKVEFQPFANAL